MIEPPFEVKPLDDLTPEEARREFEWFVGQSEARRNLLIRATIATGVPEAELDYSPESLVPLWASVIPDLRAEKPSRKKVREKLAAAPAWVRSANIDHRELSTGTRCLCVDVGFYLAEVFMRRYPDLQWSLWTKKIGPYNKSYVSGFPGPPLVPSDLVAACAWIAIDGNRSESLLLEKYRHWEEKLHD